MDKKLVENKIEIAIKKLFRRDKYLLMKDVNERSISHKLATYLQNEFKDWDVDCEYNRNHGEPKRLDIPIEDIKTNHTHAKTVFPDIIVHNRGNDENLLAIEIKKTTSQISDNFDRQKLKEFKKQLNYSYALFLKFKTGSEEIGVANKGWF